MIGRKLRQRAAEDQFHASHGTIAMLGDDDLGNVLFIRILLILIGAIDEHHDVGILFQ